MLSKVIPDVLVEILRTLPLVLSSLRLLLLRLLLLLLAIIILFLVVAIILLLSVRCHQRAAPPATGVADAEWIARAAAL